MLKKIAVYQSGSGKLPPELIKAAGRACSLSVIVIRKHPL
jgi:hypothetical protein